MKRKLSKILGIALTVAMLASLLVAAAPAAALSQPTVSFPALTDDDISQGNADYDITFTLNKQLSGNASGQDTITITFPAGTTVAAGITGTITIGPGWVDSTGAGEIWDGTPDVLGANFTGNAVDRTVTFGLPNTGVYAGRSAEVLIKITAGVTNPATIGDYALTVHTSKETTPVTSNTYAIAAPYVAPLSGVVSRYNSSNVLMGQYTGANAISLAIAASSAGDIIEVGDGTYDNSPIAHTVGGITIRATGDAAIVPATWNISGAGVDVFGNPVDTVIEGLVVRPPAAGAAVFNIQATANNTVIKNCTIAKALVLGNTQVANAGLVIAGAASAVEHRVVIENCSFDTTDGAVADTAVQVNNGPVTITNCTFNIDADTLGTTDDTAVKMLASGLAPDPVTIEGCTFTGNSGIGYSSNGIVNSQHSVTIKTSTFTALKKAVYLNSNNGTLTFTSNTVTASTAPATAVSGTAPGAIELDNCKKATIEKNTFQDNKGHTLVVGAGNANVASITFIGNTMSGNTFGVVNKNLATGLTAELNYWGSNTGPTIYTNASGTGDPIVPVTASKYGAVDFEPWTNAATSEVKTGNTVANTMLDYSTTSGVSVVSTAGGFAVTSMKYTDNPAPDVTPAPALDAGYYDVFAPAAAGTNTIMFFNPNITKDTKVYYYSALKKAWILCSPQAVAGNNGYIYITLTATTSTPTNAELNGTVFALVEEKTIPNPPSITFGDGGGPVVGAYDISVTPTFTWGAVAQAIRYEIELCEDPTFTMPEWSQEVDVPFYKSTDALKNETTYYWRVRAIMNDAGAATAWTTGIFTTEAEATSTGTGTTTPVEVTTPPAEVQIVEVGDGTGTPVIPTYLLWVIVVVGVVLIVALIVLIVRTRRVA